MQQEPREGNTFAYPVQGAGVWLASPPPAPAPVSIPKELQGSAAFWGRD